MYRMSTRLLKKWATRCVLEASMWSENYFITLTYDEEHKPYTDEMEDDEGHIYCDPGDGSWNGYLQPRDLTLFMKKLRKYWKKEFDHDNIRFFACGEYGEKYSRPHYHILMFNLPIPAEWLHLDHINKKGSACYTCPTIEKIWGNGIVCVNEFCWSAAAYTARYVTKKINGPTSSQHYASRGQTKEFVRMSRMPGIARDFYEQHKDEIYDLDEIILKTGKETVRTIKPPSYYDRLYDVDYPEDMQRIKDKRKELATEAQKVKQSKTSLSQLKQLALEESNQKLRAKALKRNLAVD